MKNYLIPISIIIAGALIAGAVIFSSSKDLNQQAAIKSAVSERDAASGIRPVSNQDHILGNPDAPVKVVEFSDLECPFCKRFHATMQQVMKEYGKGGEVAWVYRHFPLDQIHSKARKEAEATECANELGGNEKFWVYVDRLFEITSSNNNLDLAQLPQIAEDISLDRAKFVSCLESGRHAQRIADDLEDAIASGALGTPYTVAIAKNGKNFLISGAQPYDSVKSAIDAALNEK